RDVVTLIKQRYEAEKEPVGNKGIVHDTGTHIEVLRKIISYAIKENFQINDITFSPITGGDGNIEFLAHFRLGADRGKKMITIDEIEEIVNESHAKLK